MSHRLATFGGKKLFCATDPVTLVLPDLQDYSARCFNGKVLEKNTELFNWAFKLLKENMEPYHTKRYSEHDLLWDDKERARDLKKFEWEEDKEMDVFYIYELQIEETWRGKGIGSKLMGILETIAKESGLRFSLLTVCKENQRAMNFYVDRRGYSVDEISPSNFGHNVNYEILGKDLKN